MVLAREGTGERKDHRRLFLIDVGVGKKVDKKGEENT